MGKGWGKSCSKEEYEAYTKEWKDIKECSKYGIIGPSIIHKGIYGIYINNELVYIGMTTRNFEKRWIEHKKNIEDETLENSQQNYLYKEAREKGCKFKMLVNGDNFDNHEIECMEYALIKHLEPKYNFQGVRANYRFRY